MRITINTADDERGTFEARTWLDLVAPPPKPRRRPSVGGEPRAPALEEPSEKVQVPGRFPRTIAGPWLPAGRFAVKTLLNVFVELLIHGPGKRNFGFENLQEMFCPGKQKNQTVWVETRTSFAPFTWGCHVQRAKSKGCPESL